jgi:hypothetical protein
VDRTGGAAAGAHGVDDRLGARHYVAAGEHALPAGGHAGVGNDA